MDQGAVGSPAVTLSYADAAAQITAPGERYETHEITVNGVTCTAFKAAPGTLRELFDLTTLYGHTEYLVYEHERYTFTLLHICNLLCHITDHEPLHSCFGYQYIGATTKEGDSVSCILCPRHHLVQQCNTVHLSKKLRKTAYTKGGIRGEQYISANT